MRRHALLLFSLLAVAACAPGGPGTDAPSASSASSEAAPAVVLDWLVTPEADGEFDEPRASLALVIDGAVERTVELGSFAGSFADGRELSSLRATGSLLMGIFWFAGSGDEIVVRRPEPTTLTVEKRGIDEQVEPGEFEVVETVEIPAGSEVTLAEWRDQ